MSIDAKYVTAIKYYAGRTYRSAASDIPESPTTPFDSADVIGRRIKILANPYDTTEVWYQGREVTADDVLFSNGHYYKAANTGTTGNVQPFHTRGRASDGEIFWDYLHSGTASGTIVSVADSKNMTVRLDEGYSLPIKKFSADNEYTFANFQWSIWGYKNVYPSEVYILNNRLGFVCNTQGYGAWNAMSCTDDYFNFATEQFGQQLDTSAVVHLVGGGILWTLAKSQLYMGSNTEEWVVSGNQGIVSPTSLVVKNVSNAGGCSVRPLKYKDLNVFVGMQADDLLSIAYDYTIDDYVPKSVGLMSRHLLSKGVARLEAVNNKDHCIYIRHKDNSLSYLNYDRDQKILGFGELDIGEVLDICSTNAKQELGAYVAVRRNDNKISLERITLGQGCYMLDSEESDALVVKGEEYVSGSKANATVFSGDIMGAKGYSKPNLLLMEYSQVGYDNPYGETSYPVVYSITEDNGFSKVSGQSGARRSWEGVQLSYDVIILHVEPDGTYYGIRKIEETDDGCTAEFVRFNTATRELERIGSSEPFEYSSKTISAADNFVCVNGAEIVLSSAGVGTYYSGNGGGTWTEHPNGTGWPDNYAVADGKIFGVFSGGKLKSLVGGVWSDVFELPFYSLGTNIVAIEKVGDYLYGIANKLSGSLIYFKFDYSGVIAWSDVEGTSLYSGVGILDTGAAVMAEGWSGGDISVYSFAEDGSLRSMSIRDVVSNSFRRPEEKECFDAGRFVFTAAHKTILVVPILNYDAVSDYTYRIVKGNTAITVDTKDIKKFVGAPRMAGKEVYIKYGSDMGQFVKVVLDNEGRADVDPSDKYVVGLPMVCELHTQPAFGNKVEGMQQQSIAVYLRLYNSGAFQYGSSVDFDNYCEYKDWKARQEFEKAPALFTGDLALNLPMGYAKTNEQGVGKYPNTSGVGMNIRCETPEPFNLLSIQEIYK